MHSPDTLLQRKVLWLLAAMSPPGRFPEANALSLFHAFDSAALISPLLQQFGSGVDSKLNP
jgi:hypothetical protein